MEISWKVKHLFIWLLLINVCVGFPINLDTSPAEFRNQFLTGLIGVLLTICGVLCIIGCLCCQRHKGFREFHNYPVVASSTSSLDHGLTNPISNGEFTIFTPLSPFQHNNVFLAYEHTVHNETISNPDEIDIGSWFDKSQEDFSRTKLKYIKELGKGWFGRVVEGAAQGLHGNEQSWTPVAVRILEATATDKERAAFLQDAVIYRDSNHPHILQLVGRNLESIPLLLLQELCPKGDLKKYLLENQKTPEKILNTEYPLLWCCQLSSALKYLHDNQLVHPDMASRNCQILSDLTVKLGDYGLAASLYPEDYYQGAPAVPVRWCAPELLTYTSTTIQPKQITFEGNVWSLAVTMWEIFECGAQPYFHLSDDEVISHVLGSATVRLSVPKFSLLYTNYIYRLMQLCWSSYDIRPSVTQIHLMVCDLMQVYKNMKHLPSSELHVSVKDFDKRWNSFKPNSISRSDNYEFSQNCNKTEMDVDINDISVLDIQLDKNSKVMSPSLNNLHGSLDNLVESEMDSWLQNLASKTGDISYVRGLSDAFNELDNTLAMENVSSSDSSYLPSPAPENVSTVTNNLEFKLGPQENIFFCSTEFDKTQNSSFTESTQRTSSESETEDETWKRRVEQGAYSEKVHQKSKSVTDLMILTHIDYSESESETPLPSLDYRINYRNVRYAPMQNLETVSLMFGSEGNLLSVHDKFQEELKKLQEERKDSLLFVPESSFSQYKSEESGDTPCISTPASAVLQDQTSYSVNSSPSHHNSESLIEELSSPTKIQPGSQVYNIYNVRVDTMFRPNLSNIIYESSNTTCNKEVLEYKQVPKLIDIIQNNDSLMDYIISRYESQSDLPSIACEAPAGSDLEQVQFDTSLSQDQLLQNSMTHSAICLNNKYIINTDLEFSSDFGNYIEPSDKVEENPCDLTYSLETWDNFLGDTLNEPREFSSEFASFTSESQSSIEENKTTQIEVLSDTSAETKSLKEQNNEILMMNNEDNTQIINNWESEGGWFLHRQSSVDVSGELNTSEAIGDNTCYPKSMDEEVMVAIRNELLLKLPQAQGHAELVQDYEESDRAERNEIHIKYNLYTTPLSPIPEESYSESDACYYICNNADSSDTDDCDEEWPEPFEERNSDTANLETQSVPNIDSLNNGNQTRHTLSQDSYCSNDTLFNLEELTCVLNENDNLKEKNGCEKILNDAEIKTGISKNENFEHYKGKKYKMQVTFAERIANSLIVNHLNEHTYKIKSNESFLVNKNSFADVLDRDTNSVTEEHTMYERDTCKHSLPQLPNRSDNVISQSCNLITSLDCSHMKENSNFFNAQQRNNTTNSLSENCKLNCRKCEELIDKHINTYVDEYFHCMENTSSDINQNNTSYDWECTCKTNTISTNCRYIIDNDEKDPYRFDNETLSEDLLDSKQGIDQGNLYLLSTFNLGSIKNGMDSTKISQVQVSENNAGNHDLHYITEFLDYERRNIDSSNKSVVKSDISLDDIQLTIEGNLQQSYANTQEEHSYKLVQESSDDNVNVYGALTDIRFSGPGDIQLMSTSFSESADVDEHDWDSGSDTHSSSSGEFIWKEGEHEESVKALRAAPQLENPLEKAEHLEDIEEFSSESSEDEDVDSPEFIPSAWDKYATPTKSALRSPEKTKANSDKKETKPKGVWFKQQKYQCVYEYPKEPDSPILNHYDLWPTTKAILDWEIDTSPYLPSYEESNYNSYDLMNYKKSNDFYQSSNPNIVGTVDAEFYISSTTKPFEAYTGLSQFFPGASNHWVDLKKGNDNATPDSGIEDVTPLTNYSQFEVKSLKILAAIALKQSHVDVIKNNKATLGGLRHARNKLKLDLPASPNAFTYTKAFTLEPPDEPITRCEIPTFTTFGKSRFSVQQVKAPENNENANVSFEALPHKPIQSEKSKVEIVRGEASLLDSADEDSGIESSTLERKSIVN